MSRGFMGGKPSFFKFLLWFILLSAVALAMVVMFTDYDINDIAGLLFSVPIQILTWIFNFIGKYIVWVLIIGLVLVVAAFVAPGLIIIPIIIAGLALVTLIIFAIIALFA